MTERTTNRALLLVEGPPYSPTREFDSDRLIPALDMPHHRDTRCVATPLLPLQAKRLTGPTQLDSDFIKEFPLPGATRFLLGGDPLTLPRYFHRKDGSTYLLLLPSTRPYLNSLG